VPKCGADYKWCRRLGRKQNDPPLIDEALPPVISKHLLLSLLGWCSLVFMTLILFLFIFSEPMRTGAAFTLPQHVTDTKELKPQLKRLLSHFHIPYDLQELRDSAEEMELFSLVHDVLSLNTNTDVCKRKHWYLL
jgi:hypothetical protein